LSYFSVYWQYVTLVVVLWCLVLSSVSVTALRWEPVQEVQNTF